MSYAVKLEASAFDALRRLQPELAEDALDGVERLTQQPTRWSEPAALPGQRFQLYRFESSDPARRFEIEIAFQYSQDEQTLHIVHIIARPL